MHCFYISFRNAGFLLRRYAIRFCSWRISFSRFLKLSRWQDQRICIGISLSLLMKCHAFTLRIITLHKVERRNYFADKKHDDAYTYDVLGEVTALLTVYCLAL